MQDNDGRDAFLGDEDKIREKEAELEARRRKDGSIMSLSQTKKLSQVHMDNNKWEENRLFQSGVVRAREVDTDFDNDEDSRWAQPLFGRIMIL